MALNPTNRLTAVTARAANEKARDIAGLAQ